MFDDKHNEELLNTLYFGDDDIVGQQLIDKNI